jgi:hypothetical protein
MSGLDPQDEARILEAVVVAMDGSCPTPHMFVSINLAALADPDRPFRTQAIQTREVFAIPAALLDALRYNNRGAEESKGSVGRYYEVSRPGVSADGQAAIVVIRVCVDGGSGLDVWYLEKSERGWAVTAVGPAIHSAF